jgi:hypothetical protein
VNADLSSPVPSPLSSTRVAALVGAVFALPAAIASAALPAVASTAAPAPPVYRCGNTYSNTPCPGATALDVDDSRSEDERRQRLSVTARDQRLATALEAERHRRDAGPTPAPAPPWRRPGACTEPRAGNAADGGGSGAALGCPVAAHRRPSRGARSPLAKASDSWTARVPAAR